MAEKKSSSVSRGVDTSQQVFLDPNKSSKEQIADFVKMINSSDALEQLTGVIGIRKISYTDKIPPLSEIVDLNIVPKLLEFMRCGSTELQFESSWIILNICSGESNYVEYVVSRGGLIPALQLLDSDDQNIVDQAAWIIGNIAGDKIEQRDMCLKQKATEKLVTALRKFPTQASLRKTITWTLSNLVRGEPIPEFHLISAGLPVFRDVILTSTDPESHVDALWALSYISEKNAQKLINMQMIKPLIKFLDSAYLAALTPALRSLGYIIAGTDIQMNVVLAEPEFVPKLFKLIKHEKRIIRREVCWVMSNIAGGGQYQMNVLMNEDYLTLLMRVCLEDQAEVVTEACWCLSNLVTNGAKEHKSYLIKQYNFIKCLGIMLELPKKKINKLGLEALQNFWDSMQESERTFYLEELKAKGIVSKIEKYLDREDDNLRSQAESLLEIFGGDDDLNSKKLIENYLGEKEHNKMDLDDEWIIEENTKIAREDCNEKEMKFNSKN